MDSQDQDKTPPKSTPAPSANLVDVAKEYARGGKAAVEKLTELAADDQPPEDEHDAAVSRGASAEHPKSPEETPAEPVAFAAHESLDDIDAALAHSADEMIESGVLEPGGNLDVDSNDPAIARAIASIQFDDSVDQPHFKEPSSYPDDPPLPDQPIMDAASSEPDVDDQSEEEEVPRVPTLREEDEVPSEPAPEPEPVASAPAAPSAVQAVRKDVAADQPKPVAKPRAKRVPRPRLPTIKIERVKAGAIAALAALAWPLSLLPTWLRPYVDWIALSLAFWVPVVWILALFVVVR